MTIDAAFRQFHEKLKLWAFDFHVYDDVVSELQSTRFNEYAVVELPRFLVNGLKKYIHALPKTIEAHPVLHLEAPLLAVLRPFQLEGIRFVVRHGGRALIGDEMGMFIVR